MKLELELGPDLGAVLLERARAEGLSLDQFATRMLESAARADATPKRASAEERVHAFDEFLSGLESGAPLPESAFDRETWYPDR